MSEPAPRRAGRPETVLEVLRAATAYLAQHRADAPRRSAELLLGHVLSLSRIEIYLAHDRPVSEAERVTLRDLVGRRARHEPLSYLVGKIEFCGLELGIDARALVPRPETEGLVLLAAELAPPNARVADLGTGCGAIALALARRRADLEVVAGDVSQDALALARANAESLGLERRVRFVASDWWAGLEGQPPFDLAVGNPPYVDPARPELLADDVRRYEPRLALFTASGDPASCYRAILAGTPGRLRPGGWLLLETGEGAAQPALALLREAPFLDGAELRPDLAGLPRYLLARVAD